MSQRIKTNYPGVYYRNAQRIGRKGTERVYYIVFKEKGKTVEEKVGRQFIDDMTPAKANGIRSERIEGKRLSRKKIRELENAKKIEEESKWTINRLWSEYKKLRPELKGIVTDENRFKNYINPEFGSLEPGEVSPLNVDRFRIRLLKQLAPSTTKNILELLRRIINFGEKKHLCPGPGFVIEMPKVDNEKTEYLTSEQLRRLLVSIEEDTNIQVANMMKLALFSGMRRGELFRLKWEHIDFARGFIALENTKGGNDVKIPLSDAARRILEDHPRLPKTSYVFPGRNGGMRTDCIKQANRIKERAGLPSSFRAFHGLRHTYASKLASSGEVDLYVIQRLLNHKSPQMTQRYAHLGDDSLKKASNIVSKLISN